jgi:hypothetical protein
LCAAAAAAVVVVIKKGEKNSFRKLPEEADRGFSPCVNSDPDYYDDARH